MYRLCILRKRETVCSRNVKMATMHPTLERRVAIFFFLSINQTTKRSTTSGIGEGRWTSRGSCGNKPV